jgi:tRNA 2-thiouridine synthesizing protein B
MGVLHMVSRSPYESSALADCLKRAVKGDAVLLLESGVYAVLPRAPQASHLVEAGVAVYAVEADLAARGIAPEDRMAEVIPLDYEGFVELALSHFPVQSWV